MSPVRHAEGAGGVEDAEALIYYPDGPLLLRNDGGRVLVLTRWTGAPRQWAVSLRRGSQSLLHMQLALA